MSLKRNSSASTAITGGVGHEHVPQVAAETPAPTPPRRAGCETTNATIATSPPTYPSYPDAGGAHSLGHANSTASRAMARADDGTITTVPPLPARSTARFKVSLPREDARVDALPRTTSAQPATQAEHRRRTINTSCPQHRPQMRLRRVSRSPSPPLRSREPFPDPLHALLAHGTHSIVSKIAQQQKKMTYLGMSSVRA
ncbi:hypothetical protein EV714DRAFT_277967 [Schizophyllum commune]